MCLAETNSEQLAYGKQAIADRVANLYQWADNTLGEFFVVRAFVHQCYGADHDRSPAYVSTKKLLFSNKRILCDG